MNYIRKILIATLLTTTCSHAFSDDFSDSLRSIKTAIETQNDNPNDILSGKMHVSYTANGCVVKMAYQDGSYTKFNYGHVDLLKSELSNQNATWLDFKCEDDRKGCFDQGRHGKSGEYTVTIYPFDEEKFFDAFSLVHDKCAKKERSERIKNNLENIYNSIKKLWTEL